MTYITLFVIIIIFPLLSFPWTGDPAEALKKLAESPLLLIGLILTAMVQWGLFFLVWLTVWRENSSLADIGFTPFRFVHILWAIAFFGVTVFILTYIALLLEKIGLGIPGELGLIIPKDTTGRIVWVILSISAGICEETAFRGYLITRLQKLGKTSRWLIPGIVSSLIFGMGHTYQGAGGFIVITIYGGMFVLLYWRTRSLWPCIIAHSLQDLSHLFFPY